MHSFVSLSVRLLLDSLHCAGHASARSLVQCTGALVLFLTTTTMWSIGAIECSSVQAFKCSRSETLESVRVVAGAPIGSPPNARDVYSARVCAEQKQTLEENLAALGNAGGAHSEDTRQRVAQVTQMLRLLRVFAFPNSHLLYRIHSFTGISGITL